ncbi:MAG TPA: DUF4145 domain-containing protein [Bacilli bacterium]|nr:DUF4145 domain-containing protein [Bacilli bacterium]
MANKAYFYHFLESISKELAYIARGPRTMLTHARTFVIKLVEHVLQIEKIDFELHMSFAEKLALLHENCLVNPELLSTLHSIRMKGNEAAHDVRPFRYSEALLVWEAIHIVVTWYVEAYGPVDIEVEAYRDPEPNQKQMYDIAELELRMIQLEKSLQKIQLGEVQKEVAATESEETYVDDEPGLTTIRTMTYKEEQLDIPYFLRDAFLLPQRFELSETFLIRLGAVEQARIMSELPANIEGLHKYVKRYNDSHDRTFFEELKMYVAEEKARQQLANERPGELFFFFKDDYIIVTEELSQVRLTTEQFTGIPAFLRQLNADQIEYVGQLPRELVILAKYERVGIGTVEKLFIQLKEKQEMLKGK